MKKFIAAFLLSGSFFLLSAQNYAIDSMQKILLSTTDIETRVFTLLQISVEYYYSEPDSAMVYARRANSVSKEKQFALGEAQSLAIIGDLFFEGGEYVQAFESHLKALKVHEKIKNILGVAACYNNMAMIYQKLDDYQNAASYYLIAKDIFETEKKTDDLVKTLINLGYNYEMMDELDSALFYEQRAYTLGLQVKDSGDIAAALIKLGNIHQRLQKNDAALNYYRSSIPLALQVNDKQLLSKAQFGMASVFKATGKTDSSLLLAKQSLSASTEISYAEGMVNAYTILSNWYETQNKTDSAFKYQTLNMALKDSLFSVSKAKAMQFFSFNERMRQQKEAAQLQYRNRLRLYALIGGSILLLLVTAFLLRINHLKKEHLIRTKLSKDLHDDLGGTLNSIKVYTNIALIQKEEQYLQNIKEGTQEAISCVRDIIWVLNDQKDNMADLLIRVQQFAAPLCESNNIRYIQQIEDEAYSYKLEQEEKRNLYLIIKEFINNTIKYANAGEIYLIAKLFNKRKLCIQVKDNGRGFDLSKKSEGNGLKNMKYRAEQTGYDFTMRSIVSQGTFIELKKS